MHLQRMKQGYINVRRKFGVHGRILLDHESIQGQKTIYTLESPWNFNKDEPNGILGVSCVPSATYTLSIEQSPLNHKYYPFLVNEKMGICLRAKNNAKDKTGHAFVDFDNMDPREIFGRFILCGLGYRYDSKGYFIPTQTEEAVNILNTYIRESGDTSLTISWN